MFILHGESSHHVPHRNWMNQSSARGEQQIVRIRHQKAKIKNRPTFDVLHLSHQQLKVLERFHEFNPALSMF